MLCDTQSAWFRPTYVTTHEIVSLQCTLCLMKKIPDIFNCNSNKRRWILVIFGSNVSHKVGNGQMHNFLPRLTGVFALSRKTGTTENVPFPSMLCTTLLTNTHNTSNVLPGHRQSHRRSFINKTINCMHQTWPTQDTKHPVIWYALSQHSPCLTWCWAQCHLYLRLFG